MFKLSFVKLSVHRNRTKGYPKSKSLVSFPLSCVLLIRSIWSPAKTMLSILIRQCCRDRFCGSLIYVVRNRAVSKVKANCIRSLR